MLKEYIDAIRTEKLKLRHSKILLPCILLPVLGTFIGSGNYMANKEALDGTWNSLWTQVALFYGYFFYPVLLSICAAYTWRMEHRNHNWNFLMTAPIPKAIVFTAKLSVAAGIGFFVQVFLTVLYWAAGTLLLHFAEPFPIGSVMQWILTGWIASFSVAALQLYLSMRIRSFAVPVGISLGTCIVGLAFYTAGLGKFFPTSLLTMGLGAAAGIRIAIGDMVSVIFNSLLYTGIFCFMAVRFLKRKDIVAN